MWSYGGVGKHFKTHCRSFVYPSQTAVGRLCTAIKSLKQKNSDIQQNIVAKFLQERLVANEFTF